MLKKLKQELQNFKNKERAIISSRFFKTGKGQYGEGDVFLGITVPQQRAIAKKYSQLSLNEIEKLLSDKIHEYRLIALIILVAKYKKSNEKEKKEIAEFYLNNAKSVNNWDLVDSSAHQILGNYLFEKDKTILYTFATSKNLWERRIAIISTYHFIQNNQYENVFKISEILLNDTHDLIHKAVGWMLREVGKRNQKEEEDFLMKHYKKMPRTMLRYAIEKFEEGKRKKYLDFEV